VLDEGRGLEIADKNKNGLEVLGLDHSCNQQVQAVDMSRAE